ncbi:MAG: hypothetical protein R2941_05215 [Desulfobacterales bacterium]
MLTASQKKKFMAFFNQLDTDKSGTIEFRDFAVQAFNKKMQKGWSDDSAEWKKLIESKQKAWNGIQKIVDLNNDGRVSAEEWLVFCEKAMARSKSGETPEWLTRLL